MAEALLNARITAGVPLEPEPTADEAIDAFVVLLMSLRTEEEQGEVCSYAMHHVKEARRHQQEFEMVDQLVNLSRASEKKRTSEPTLMWVSKTCPTAAKELRLTGRPQTFRPRDSAGSSGGPLRYFDYEATPVQGARPQAAPRAAGKSGGRPAGLPSCVQKMRPSEQSGIYQNRSKPQKVKVNDPG